MNPDETEFWFLPLGGCGEIGMNLNLFGHNGQWLMVDCGVTFAKPGSTEPQVQMPDPQFIVDRKDALLALLITHAHEDHLGAVAHLWPKLQCPVYATPFAAQLLTHKLVEQGLLSRVDLRLIQPGARQQLGSFDVHWLGVTHSTPESHALMVRTPVGSAFHTGDWKLDVDPVVGARYDKSAFTNLAAESPTALICDSTNALVPGRSVSEGDLTSGLMELVEDAPGRVVVGCFGSNVARLRTLALVAKATGRYCALLGRSLKNYYRAALAAGLWDQDLHMVDADHLGYLPATEVLAIATGSQGESGAALSRLAANNHPAMELEPGDRVLFSSRTIPGNELAITALVQRLESLGVAVVTDAEVNKPIHASGHPATDELLDMFRWVKPQAVIPVHGEPSHMAANAALAKQAGVRHQLTGTNGDLFLLAPALGVRREFAHTGRLGLDRGQLVTVDECR